MTVDLRLAIPAAVGWAATIVLVGLPESVLPAVIVGWLAAGGLTRVWLVTP